METSKTTLAVSYHRSSVLDLFLAVQRELMGRFAHESVFLPCPVVPEVTQFVDGLRDWGRAGLTDLPMGMTHASSPAALLETVGPSELRSGSDRIAAAMLAAAPTLEPVLTGLDGLRTTGEADLRRLLPLDRFGEPLRAALGLATGPLTMQLYLVPLAPHFPGVGFLTAAGRIAACYADCRRFTGATLADAVLALFCWTLLKELPGKDNLLAELSQRMPGQGRHHRRLRAVATKIMIEKLSAHLIRSVEPDHRPCVDVLGAIWRYPRLAAVVDRHWGRYLAGLVAREECLTDLANELGGRHPRWYVEDVDATSLAADFYVLEWLSAAGDDQAQRRFAQWVPGLADYFARQIDLTIGGELGHFERARRHRLPEPVGSFIERVTAGDSRVAWWRTRRELGQLRALSLAAETFNGPGVEYGGEAWGPVAATLRRYLELEIPPAIFVDQCFSLEHNNGSLFDKYFATEGLRELLDAQAAGDLLALTARASAEVRRLWHRHRARHRAGYDPRWLWTEAEASVDSPTPILARSSAAPVSSSIGSLGCGSALAPEVYSPEVGDEPNAPQPWRGVSRRRPPPPLPGRPGCSGVAVLYTTVGPITIELWPTSAPHTVDAFVGLARGSLAWQDPLTRQPGVGGFYDHTTFHRRIPGFLIQGGDRSGTGEGGPGFRIPDEFDSTSVFDRPYLVAMANTGPNSAGSQFFITLAAAPHLNGGYSRFGEVTDEVSRERVTAIADATAPVINERVDVTIW